MSSNAVSTIQDFIRKYGTDSLDLVVSEYIQRAPAFKGDAIIAVQIGEMMADLKTALRNL